jgi:ATP-dependent helicase HrpA
MESDPISPTAALRTVHDRTLPPDHAAFVAAEPPTGRVIVIAPTRAACETIELALRLHLDTLLEREHGAEIRELARSGKGFGIVAGTGTGKTLSIRPIAEQILGTTELRVGVVNREREATPETPTWNVIIVTTGIARRWFEENDILSRDTLLVDEIHQTSAELELCLALGKRAGCRFIWLSATVDPTFYRNYLGSAAVLRTFAFDPDRAATVKVLNESPDRFLSDRFLQQVMKQRRGVGVFLPTRAGVEAAATLVGERFPRIHAAFYHGGEPIRVIRPFLEDGAPRPYVLAMTAAGQSALNVRGLDTVVIDDTRFTNVVEKGKNVLTRTHLGANEILQMAGRVHGRVEGGQVFILSDRELVFHALEPTAPEFQLAGDSERVAMTCAALGVRADELELPVPLDRIAYRRALAELESRGIVENGRLTKYGKLVEATPVERPWAELLVQADDALVPALAVMASAESLHRMTREDRNLEGLIVQGSDHLTAYNVYAEALARAGYIGEVYGLPRHLFDEGSIERWAERRGVLIKAIEDTALAMASVCRSLDVPLPKTLPMSNEAMRRSFCDLLARVMPFDLVIDEETADGHEARVSKTSVCGSWGAITGTLRYFADRFGIPRASIEGTQLAASLVRRYATTSGGSLVLGTSGSRDTLVLSQRVTYHGFELERDDDVLDDFPAGREDEARQVLATALASGEARHPAVRRNRRAIDEMRELYRRSGGMTPRLNQSDLVGRYMELLSGVTTMDEFRAAPLKLDLWPLIAPADRERLLALPSAVEIRGKWVDVEYDIEQAATGEQRS